MVYIFCNKIFFSELKFELKINLPILYFVKYVEMGVAVAINISLFEVTIRLVMYIEGIYVEGFIEVISLEPYLLCVVYLSCVYTTVYVLCIYQCH